MILMVKKGACDWKSKLDKKHWETITFKGCQVMNKEHWIISLHNDNQGIQICDIFFQTRQMSDHEEITLNYNIILTRVSHDLLKMYFRNVTRLSTGILTIQSSIFLHANEYLWPPYI